MKVLKHSTITDEYWNPFFSTDYFSFDIRPYMNIMEFEPDEVILKENETPEYLYFLFDGRAKLFLTHSNGKISLINFISAPSFIGEMELINAQETANSIIAITKCHLFAIRIHECNDKLLNDTVFLKHLCVFLGKKAIANTSNYSKNQSYPLQNRLASFILITSHNGLYTEKHTEAAEYLGVTYRHLLYVIADYVKQGILVKSASGYQIFNSELLKILSCKQ